VAYPATKSPVGLTGHLRSAVALTGLRSALVGLAWPSGSAPRPVHQRSLQLYDKHTGFVSTAGNGIWTLISTES